MLEVTILKVRHAGAREVVQSHHYIDECDIFGTENFYYTKRKAEQDEWVWASLLQLPHRKRQRVLESEFPLSEHPDDSELYNYLEQSYVLVQGKPLWFAERFSEEEAKEGREKRSQEMGCLLTAFAALQNGDIEKFFTGWKNTFC